MYFTLKQILIAATSLKTKYYPHNTYFMTVKFLQFAHAYKAT